MHAEKQCYCRFYGDRIAAADILRWSFAGAVILSGYIAGAVALYSTYAAGPEHLSGSPSAVMFEFAAEPTSPEITDTSDVIQSAMQLHEAGPVSKAEENPVLSESLVPADDPIRKAEHKIKQNFEQKENNSPGKPVKKLRDNISRGKQNQKSSAPEIDARNSQNFTGRANRRSDGFNGKSEKAWIDRVHRKIQRVGRRMQHQLPGIQGVVYVSFTYDTSGKISTVDISHSSGNIKIDQLALRIVEHSSPLPEPPDAGRKIVPIHVN